MSALTIEEELYQAMLEESRKLGTFGHGFTYTAHPVGCAVALKAIEIYQRDQVIQHAARVSTVFQARIKALADHPLVGEARGLGLIGAVELVADKKTKRSFAPKHQLGIRTVGAIQDQGVIVRNIQDTIAFCPPLIISEDEIHEMFDLVENGLNTMEQWVRKEGARGE
jgi:4-aminobutyrate--pyruvate transaminase